MRSNASQPSTAYGGPALLLLVAGIQALLWAPRGFAQPAGLLDRRIVALEFQCAASIDERGLRELLLPLAVGSTLRAGDLEEAKRRLTSTELFTSVVVEADARGADVAVVARLVRKSVVNAIRFRGNDTLSDDTLWRAIRMREGTALSDELRDYAVGRIDAAYGDQGFDAVQVVPEIVVRGAGEVDIVFRITEGEPLRIGAVEIPQDLPVAADEIREAIAIEVGDRYVPAKAAAAKKAVLRFLRAQRYYEADVDVTWESRGGRTGVLRFNIDLGPRYSITFSGNTHFDDEHLMDLMDLPGRPIITDGTWRELARRARRAYQGDGYYFAKVDVEIQPGPPKIVRVTVLEGQVFHIGEVTFAGNHGLSAAELSAPMATRPPSWIPWRRGVLLDDVFDDDLKRLWFLYRREGFESAEIADARTRFEPAQGKVFVTVVIEEGPRTIVRRLEHVGVEPIAQQLPEPTVMVGAPLNPDTVEADRQALVTALAKAGYTRAEVTTDIQSEPGTTIAATVRFIAKPGAQHRVGALIVQNNVDTRSRVILRELEFKSGDPLNPDALLRGQSKIYGLGLFRTVTVRPLDESEATVHDVGVSVSEKPPGSVQWGAGYNTRDGIRGFVEVSHNNLQGLARRVSLRGDLNFDPADVGPNEYIGNLGFREPRLVDTKWIFRTNLIGQRSTRSVDQFSVERFAFIPAIERTLLPNLQAGMELQVEHARIFDVAPDVLVFNPRDEGRLRTIGIGPFAVYDGRDDAFVPRRGVYDSVRVRFAPGEFASDVPFVKVIAQHSHYIPLDDEFTVVYAIRSGWARAYEGGEQMPIRERFFLGGRTTVRGFGENQIGPVGAPIIDALGRVIHPGGNPLGGDFTVNLNSELRFPLLYGLGGAVFVDGGGVYLQDRPIRLDDFRRAAGFGLRYTTPVGPISLDYGFKLDRRSGESLGEVHFSIGAIF